MILKMDVEQLFPSSGNDWNRKRKRLFKLLASANDLLSNARASSLLPYDLSTLDGRCLADSERRYFYRLGCAHLHEALTAFGDCHRSGILQTFRPLCDEGELAVEGLVRASSHPNSAGLRDYLERVRNNTFHYSYAGTMPGEGYLLFGEGQTRNDCRFVLAEDAIMSQIHGELATADDPQALSVLVNEVVQLRNDVVRFVDHLAAAIYEKHREAFSLETSWPGGERSK